MSLGTAAADRQRHDLSAFKQRPFIHQCLPSTHSGQALCQALALHAGTREPRAVCSHFPAGPLYLERAPINFACSLDWDSEVIP